MVPEHERNGMNWAENIARNCAASLGVGLKRVAWGQSDQDFASDRWSLVLKTCGGARRVLTFDADDIADCGTCAGGKRPKVESAIKNALHEMREAP
jgi:hypothetical protein